MNTYARKVCNKIFQEATQNIASKGSFTFVLSGGRTPKSIFKLLLSEYKEKIEWEKVHFFWLDERCVSPSDRESNYKLAFDYLLSSLEKIGSVHRIEGELHPELAREKYENDLLRFFGTRDNIIFDFILFGMGEDGHVASIFPKSKEMFSPQYIVLNTEEKYNGFYRITLGLAIINQSKFKLLLANNVTKIRILESNDLNYPINLVQNKSIII